ncbi:transcriptional regulator [Pontibacillus halophilus JSM 076056 = DSM 19796]|uniref:Transcriptional regulator n=1 Tax=Pontibacillus halophilus JSM 076056 = DSM 19796 TaxID=1385510 RepID=A0A0A5GN75_9BACI|nr:HTH-type transcriptional regulator Hpr [Pontibacillus halophilus]KGX92605.1 transcriptional regulator [Pontibacillus halophilus JSM 076056 = DSM 19796]
MKNEYSMKEAIMFSHKMAQLSKALWKSIEKDWQKWIKPFDLNINEHHILWISYHLNGASVSEVSKFGVMHVSTAFNFSKKLEERGLLTFSKRENDKRNTYIQLTKEGEELLLETMKSYKPESNSLLEGSMPLKEMYGKFPEFQDLSAVVRKMYGDDYMEIFERTMSSIEYEYLDEDELTQKTQESNSDETTSE